MTHDYEEKRSFARIRVETTVRFRVKNSDVIDEGVSQDLSATGLLMQTRQTLPVGAELYLEMSTENDRLPPFIASGKVLRTEPDPADHSRYLISVALTSTR